jgi:hypothetical protein
LNLGALGAARNRHLAMASIDGADDADCEDDDNGLDAGKQRALASVGGCCIDGVDVPHRELDLSRNRSAPYVSW